MAITVRFFAGLRERLGRDSQLIEYKEHMSARQVWEQAADGLPLSADILVALNMECVPAETGVADGDEVAFFPPVTGGRAG